MGSLTNTLGILFLSIFAFSIDTAAAAAAGLLMSKVMYRVTNGEVNSLIGVVRVIGSAVAARVLLTIVGLTAG